VIDTQLDWASFLGNHAMTWHVKPMSWNEGAFIGNGTLGAMIYSEEHRDKRHVLRFVLGRTDVVARRPGGGYPPRVPVGELHLEMEGWLYQPFSMTLDLWNAELRAGITTTAGEIRLSAFVHSRDGVLAIDLQTSEGEKHARAQWYPYHEVDPILKNADGFNLNQYIPEIVTERFERKGVRVGRQSFMPAGAGGCVTAWMQTKEAGSRRIYATIDNQRDEETVNNTVASLLLAGGQPWDAWVQSHRNWWHDYYRQSFVSIPDPIVEGFYWIQIYKLASATRAEGKLMDNQGPWLTTTPWPGLWFNMNVQVAYSPVYTSNRLEIGKSLVRAFSANFDQLIANVPEPFRADSAGIGRSCSYDLVCPVGQETGNLLWVCHNLWRHYKYSMDEALLRDLLYPLLKRAVQYHIHLLQEGQDGKLHLPPTISPEYGSFLQLAVPDAHYDLALLQWGCETLLAIHEMDGFRPNAEIGTDAEDALRRKWRDVLARLTPLPVDETGYMIGRGQPLEFGHRHYSHLMAIFPLHLVNVDNEEERELALRSLRHWLSRDGDLRGFTFSGAASIAATLGLGDEALRYVKSLIHLLKPNTMYREAGPVIESPLGGAEAIQDMLLQSWGEGIRVFPAIPESWQEAVFHDLRAEGAFLVSALRNKGRTAWLRVKSLAGSPCQVRTDFTNPVQAPGEKPVAMHSLGGGWLRLELEAGAEVNLYADHAAAAAGNMGCAQPVAAGKAQQYGYFGGSKPWRLFELPVL